MKKLISAAIMLCASMCVLAAPTSWRTEKNVPKPSRYESFEDGMPKNWTLQGKGKVSTNPYHYKLGKKSLQWDFKAGDAIKISNTIGNIKWRGGRANACYAHFGVWVYCEKPMAGKSLRFEFRVGEKVSSYFDFPLNFKGWQCGFPGYRAPIKSPDGRKYNFTVSGKEDNIVIKAPGDTDGTVLIDCLVYNGPMYYVINFLPNAKPWQAPKIDESKFPLPGKISDSDKKMIERVKGALVSPRITATAWNKGFYYKLATDNIKRLEIVEDEHGIRGRPINLPRWHDGSHSGALEFLTENGIAEKDVEGFNNAMLAGGPKNRYSQGISRSIKRAVENGITQAQYETLCKEYAKVWRYLLDQGFNTSAGNGHYSAASYVMMITTAYLMRETLIKHGLLETVSNYLQYNVYTFFIPQAKIVSMDYFGSSQVCLYGAFLCGKDEKAQLQALRFFGDRFSREITTDYGFLGFKEDGCGMHCEGNMAFDYMMNGVQGIAKVAYLLSDSSAALSEKAYNTLKHIVLRIYFYTSSLNPPLFLQGTGVFHPLSLYSYRLPDTIKYLALAGKGGCDRELAQAYVNLKHATENLGRWARIKYDPVFETKYGIKPSPLPSGNISMPYAPLVAQRRNGWLAVVWGGGIDMRDRGNHYGYAMWNGPLTILGKDGLAASGIVQEGWDWNRPAGTTVLYIPELIDIKYSRAKRKMPDAAGFKKCADWYEQFKNSNARETYCSSMHYGNGGMSWRGTNGCFRRIFANDMLNNAYCGIKSYFFINNRIYALGSNLTSYSKKYRMQTNLYQQALKDKSTPTYVDGQAVTAFPVTDKALDGKKAHHLIAPCGNGYFIPANQKVFVARKQQKSRKTYLRKTENSSGNFATAWLDHGIQCKEAKYAYVIMPYCDKAAFAKFSAKDYEILRQNEFAHILHDKIDGFYAGIFFKGGKVAKLPHVANVERACQIMFREVNKKLEIAVGDPAPHRDRDKSLLFGSYGGRSQLKVMKVTFSGNWKLESPVDGVKIISSGNGKTVIEFACIHGRDFNFTLLK